ncbi:MerR family transcriptional regulator [Cytobacillus spongiae]|jgi:DNA-binding transcriptional MerR regulator|uniref:MerR family transcriptional regulator n=1 Tax=Cytobacillus spongiae TaxID=2901381 RepID=UPI001F2961C6|nr:MerR family transcriptional regulator [Cytobacillus spongiae]UII55501.1 MerR family transcriptional regulator [Cytobacillus spongiae]
MKRKKKYRIGELSERIGISKDTIRHWQRKGILPTQKDENNYNSFGEDDYYQLFQIHIYRGMGFSITDIKEMLLVKDFQKRKAFIQHRIKQINQEIEQLSYQRQALEAATHMKPSRDLEFKTIRKTFKLQQLDISTPSQFSILENRQDQLVFISHIHEGGDHSHSIFIEVEDRADYIFPGQTFVHFTSPKHQLTDKEDQAALQKYALKENLILLGDIIEVHDLKQLLYHEYNYVDYYVAVDENKN